MKKILYITYDGLTDALGQSQILSYLSKLSQPDRKIVILSFEKNENYERNADYVKTVADEANIEWIKLWYHKKPPVLSTIKDIRRGIKTAKELNKKHGFNIVHCRGYVSGMIGLRLKCPKLIFDMRGWFPDEKKDAGDWNYPLYKPVYFFFKSLEKRLFKKSAFNVSLTFAGKKEIVAKNFSSADKIGVVPTCVNLAVFKPFDENVKKTMREKLGIPLLAKVLIYSGSVGGNYDVDRMIKIFAGFLSVYSSAHILILSKDEIPPDFFAALKNAGIKNVLIKNVTYREVSHYLQAGDVGMIFYKPAFSNIGRSPTKLAEYWASGIPVISFRNIGDLEYLFEKYTLGGVLCNEDLNDIQERVADLKFGFPDQLRKYATEYFSLEKGVQFYESVYERLA